MKKEKTAYIISNWISPTTEEREFRFKIDSFYDFKDFTLQIVVFNDMMEELIDKSGSYASNKVNDNMPIKSRFLMIYEFFIPLGCVE